MGPLEEGLYYAPVLINGRGPYLFAFDPDARHSVIDELVVKQGKLPTKLNDAGWSEQDDYGEPQRPRTAYVGSLEIGTLVLKRQIVRIARAGAFNAGGRHVSGILGRDMLADSLVFGFDRDRGLGFLSTVKAFRPAAQSTAIPFTTAATNGHVRRVSKATLGDRSVTMALELRGPSALGDAAATRAGLSWSEAHANLTDEYGTSHPVLRMTARSPITLAPNIANAVTFAPMAPRWRERLDGSLGADFFRPFDVWVSFDASAYFLSPRVDVPVTTRLARWYPGPFTECPHVGCIELRVIDPDAGAVDAPIVLSITRDVRARDLSLEVVLEATGLPVIPRLVVNLPPEVDHLDARGEPALRGRSWVVVDASPYPHSCPSAGGCVVRVAR